MVLSIRSIVIAASIFISVESFRSVRPPRWSISLKSHGVHDDGKITLNTPSGNSVSVYQSPETLASALCNDFILSAQNAITRSGRFFVVSV